MARRYRRKGQKLSLWEGLDWSINPETTREIIGVALIIIAIYVPLAQRIRTGQAPTGKFWNFFESFLTNGRVIGH